MSTPTKGNCCVCGEETDKRCSACSFAGVDLFFCSREHQKLIWKTHGKVCGVNSNPFRPPDFSSDEIELAKRTLHTSLEVAAPRCRQLSAYPPSTLRQMTCGAVLSIALEVPQADGGQSVIPILKQPPKDWTEAQRAKRLSLCRSTLHSFATGGDVQPKHFRTLDLFVISAALQAFCDEVVPLSPLDRTRAQHLSLVLATVLRHANSPPFPPSYDQFALDRFCATAFQHLLDLLLAAHPLATQQECFSLVSKLSAIVSAGFPGVVQLVSPPGEDGQGWKVAVIDAADAPEYARKMASR